jgi:hypothetical protein
VYSAPTAAPADGAERPRSWPSSCSRLCSLRAAPAAGSESVAASGCVETIVFSREEKEEEESGGERGGGRKERQREREEGEWDGEGRRGEGRREKRESERERETGQHLLGDVKSDVKKLLLINVGRDGERKNGEKEGAKGGREST